MTSVMRKQEPEMTPAQIEALRPRVVDLVKKGKVRVMCDHVFFATLLCKRDIEISSKISTACVDLRGNIKIGIKFAATLNVQQMVFLLCHECLHHALLHGMRMKSNPRFKHRPANVAMDKVINDLLVFNNVGQKIESGIFQPGARNFAWEQLYEECEGEGGGGGDPGEGGGTGDPGSGGGGNDYTPGEDWDDLDTSDPITEAELREIEATVRVEVAQASQMAKMKGQFPAGMDRIVDDIINPKTPWHELTERFMTQLISNDYSWRRPRKATMAHGYYMPSSNRVPRMGEMVIAADSSGSISREIPHFIGHMNAILELCLPEKVYFVHCDAEVHQVDEYTPDDLPVVVKKIKGGGGTDFRPVFDWIDEQGISPECVVYLTDMYGTFPDKAPLYPVIWLATTDEKAPWGDVVRYHMEG